jgi:hypothetical protein
MSKRKRQEPLVNMQGWVLEGYILRVDDVGSDAVENPYVGTVIDTRTSKVVHTIYGKYFFRVMGQLNIWYWQNIEGA